MVLVPPNAISDVYSSNARLLSPTYGTYLITTCWWGGGQRKQLQWASTPQSLPVSKEAPACSTFIYSRTYNRSHIIPPLSTITNYLHSDQAVLLAYIGCCLTAPCHLPHCSLRLLWSGIVQGQRGYAHHYFLGGYSWPWRLAARREGSNLLALFNP